LIPSKNVAPTLDRNGGGFNARVALAALTPPLAVRTIRDQAMTTWPYPPATTPPDVAAALRALTAEALALPAPAGAWIPPNLEKLMQLEQALETLGRARHVESRARLVELYEHHHLPEIRRAAGRALLALASDEEIRARFGVERAQLAEAVPVIQTALGDVRPLVEALLGRKRWKKPARGPAAKKPAKRPTAARAAFLRFGSHRGYDGDNPWWTVRFAHELSASERARVAHLALRAEVSASAWKQRRQVQIGADDPFFESEREWTAFYARVERLFAVLHAELPIFAIFFQEGQFHAGKPLVGLDDAALAKLRPPSPRRKK
jgi:hypothetical protein